MKKILLVLIIVSLFSCKNNKKVETSGKEIRVNDLKLENPITEAWLKENLTKNPSKLFFTPEVEKNLREKIKSDSLVRKSYLRMKANANEILTKPLIERRFVGFRMRGTATSLHKRLSILSIVYRIDKDPEILRRIDAELLKVCDYPHWNPEHFLDIGELAFGVALAIDWAGEDLPAETVRLTKLALIEKAIIPSYDENGIRMAWVKGKNNWTAICHAGLIAASLVTADVDPALAAITIARGIDNITPVLADYYPDGAYPEGAHYYKYGTRFLIQISDIFISSFGTDFGIKKFPGLLESANYFYHITAPSGAYFNYADCNGGGNGKAGMWFAMNTGNGLFFGKEEYKNLGNSKALLGGPNLIQYSQYTPQEVTELPLDWCGQGLNPLAVFRGEKEDPGQFYLAVKGGSASCSHGNMDAGSFVFELNGVRWIIDLGNQGYNQLNDLGLTLGSSVQTSDRWTLLTKNNYGHSTITVNDALFKVYGYAPITEFKPDGKSEVSIDLREMYGDNLLSAKRKFVKESNQSILIEDKIEVNERTEIITWTLMTIADVEPVENGAVLKKDGKELKLSILSPANSNISVVSLNPPPLYYDKHVENLKRIEIKVPASVFSESKNKGTIQVQLAGI